jgi:hypothetical protein
MNPYVIQLVARARERKEGGREKREREEGEYMDRERER